MRPIYAFLGGVAVALAIGLSVLVATGISHAQSQRNAQICALDKAIVSVLQKSEANIPASRKYDKYRVQTVQDIELIQQASAC